MKRVALYIRVSTSKQDTENQRRELQAVADRSGWKIVKVYEDAGISGAKGRDQRPGLDAMMKTVNTKEFDMVATWSVDRLGRSLTELLGILQGLHEKGVGLFLHQQGLDTSTTAGKAMFQMLGVFAEFERGIIRERVNAGLGVQIGDLAGRLDRIEAPIVESDGVEREAAVAWWRELGAGDAQSGGALRPIPRLGAGAVDGLAGGGDEKRRIGGQVGGVEGGTAGGERVAGAAADGRTEHQCGRGCKRAEHRAAAGKRWLVSFTRQ